ncbi:MAG: hypothetical protein ACM3ME_00635, partial [Chloroflexota bacterium]
AHKHKEEAVNIKCQDCHKRTLDDNNHRQISETDRETQLIAWIKGWNNNTSILLTGKNGKPIINAWFDVKESKSALISKISGKVLQLKPPLSQCVKNKAHKRLSCETCHTAWVPQCIGCHNAFEKETEGYDMLKRKPRKGTWVEYSAEAIAEAPVLGMKNTNLKRDLQEVGIFSPGMIMTIDFSQDALSEFSDRKKSELNNRQTFHRLYAPVSGHTTQRTSRSCISCHLNPLALGFGRGTLELSSNGSWTFNPVYSLNKNDHLPEDAWTRFLQERNDQSVTRINMRPFNLKEQKRILQAGACLTCHDEKSSVIQKCLDDFNGTIKQASSKCIIPWRNN